MCADVSPASSLSALICSVFWTFRWHKLQIYFRILLRTCYCFYFKDEMRRENLCTLPAADCPLLSSFFVILCPCNRQNPEAAVMPHCSSTCHAVCYNSWKSKAAPEGVAFLPSVSALPMILVCLSKSQIEKWGVVPGSGSTWLPYTDSTSFCLWLQ